MTKEMQTLLFLSSASEAVSEEIVSEPAETIVRRVVAQQPNSGYR